MTRRGVYAHVTGGLGNQLFQYAAALELADAWDTSPHIFPPKQGWPAGHPTVLNVLPHVLVSKSGFVRSLSKVALRVPALDARASRPSGVIAKRVRPGFQVIRADFDPIGHISSSRVAILSGLFQHPSWWTHSARKITSSLLKTHGSRISEHASDLVIAFRRTDYLSMGVDLPYEFYEQALRRVAVEPEAVVRLVSEDKAFLHWVAALLAREGVTAIPTLVGDPLDDFWTIAGGRNVIMANSSFSWWATRVGDLFYGGSDRVVVCPVPWMPSRRYRMSSGNEVNLIQDTWLGVAGEFVSSHRPATK